VVDVCLMSLSVVARDVSHDDLALVTPVMLLLMSRVTGVSVTQSTEMMEWMVFLEMDVHVAGVVLADVTLDTLVRRDGITSELLTAIKAHGMCDAKVGDDVVSENLDRADVTRDNRRRSCHGY